VRGFDHGPFVGDEVVQTILSTGQFGTGRAHSGTQGISLPRVDLVDEAVLEGVAGPRHLPLDLAGRMPRVGHDGCSYAYSQHQEEDDSPAPHQTAALEIYLDNIRGHSLVEVNQAI